MRDHAVPGLSWVLVHNGREYHVIPEADYLKGHRSERWCPCEPSVLPPDIEREDWVILHHERPTA